MASTHRDVRTGIWAVHWRYVDRQFKQSTGEPLEGAALAAAERVEKTIKAIADGFLTLPPDADYKTVKHFIYSGGKQTRKHGAEIAGPAHTLTLEAFFQAYRDSQPTNEDSTLYTELIHQNHFLRILGPSKEVESITFDDIETYIKTRKKGYGKYRKVGRETINKELKTLRKLWTWGMPPRGYIKSPVPWETKKLIPVMPREVHRERFRDFDEIQAILKDGGLSEKEESRYWESLYLRGEDVAAVLDHVREQVSAPFVYPMFTLCALTGCRRSEAIRSLKRDFDFRREIVTLRAKKRDHSKDVTLRYVPMHPRLKEVMFSWFATHPGGQYAICDEEGKRITVRSGRLDREFANALVGSKWTGMRGWHCFRHSFASILASKGIDQRIINKFMDHLNAKTVARYQHLYKETGQHAVLSLLSPLADG